MRRLAAVLIAAIALAGCSARERDNPFDPGNPVTQGRPTGFVAIAEHQAVRLRWNAVSSGSLLGYRLERRLATSPTWVPISGLLSPATDRFFDFGLPNGLTFEYRIFFELTTGPGTNPATDFATPGPLQPWVADYGAGRVTRVSADGRHAAASFRLSAFAGPADIEVDPRDGRVWVPSPYEGRVYLLEPADSTLRTAAAPLDFPVAVAIDPLDGSAWIGDDGFDGIRHVDALGAPLPGAIDLVRGPLALATDPGDRSLWAVERDGAAVRRFDVDGLPLASAPVPAPSRVAVDSLTGDAWVASLSAGEVRRLSRTGTELARVGLDGPLGIAVDARRRRVWVADARSGEVLALHLDGRVERVIATGGGPYDVAVDAATGDVWVVLRDARELRRYGADGAERARVGGFSDPVAVTLDPGPRAAMPHAHGSTHEGDATRVRLPARGQPNPVDPRLR